MNHTQPQSVRGAQTRPSCAHANPHDQRHPSARTRPHPIIFPSTRHTAHTAHPPTHHFASTQPPSARTHHAVVEGEDAHVPAMVDVIAAHDRVGVVLHPDTRQRVPTDLIVLVNALENNTSRRNTARSLNIPETSCELFVQCSARVHFVTIQPGDQSQNLPQSFPKPPSPFVSLDANIICQPPSLPLHMRDTPLLTTETFVLFLLACSRCF